MKRVFLWILLMLTTGAIWSIAQEKAATKASNAKAGGASKQAMIREALSAAPPEIGKTATIKDWDGNVLKQGSGGYTCYPTPPMMKKMGKEPMCVDKVSRTGERPGRIIRTSQPRASGSRTCLRATPAPATQTRMQRAKPAAAIGLSLDRTRWSLCPTIPRWMPCRLIQTMVDHG